MRFMNAKIAFNGRFNRHIFHRLIFAFNYDFQITEYCKCPIVAEEKLSELLGT
jgi:hypothetical protein